MHVINKSNSSDFPSYTPVGNCYKCLYNISDQAYVKIKLTLKKCGRRRPIEYLPTSVVSWLTTAPNPKTPIWMYELVTHVGISHRPSRSFLLEAFLFIFDWTISVMSIWKYICGYIYIWNLLHMELRNGYRMRRTGL